MVEWHRSLEVVVNPAGARPDPAFWRGRRVLLTGHTGFKGSWLALWLLQMGADVMGVALEPPSAPALFDQLDLVASALRHRRCDLGDTEGLTQAVRDHRPEVVLHLAAQALVREGYRQPLTTWNTNVMGTLQLLEVLRQLRDPCAVVAVTTDKVYANSEDGRPFREQDPLGGHDPYSGSKAAMELAIASWRQSFCGEAPHQTPHLRLVSARAGNVIGGGDWAHERIVPDTIRALQRGEPILVRNPRAVRPWQHVLEPLAGYMLLAERVATDPPKATSFNFAPAEADQRRVDELVVEVLHHWPGSWQIASNPSAPQESERLLLDASLAGQILGWIPRWSFVQSVAFTVQWYRRVHEGESARELCLEQINNYVAGTR